MCHQYPRHVPAEVLGDGSARPSTQAARCQEHCNSVSETADVLENLEHAVMLSCTLPLQKPSKKTQDTGGRQLVHKWCVCLKNRDCIPYLCVSSHLVAPLQLEAHCLPQVYPGCRVERVVRPWGGMDRVETPHTGRARRQRAVDAAAARSEADTQRRIAVQAGGSDYGSYGGLVAVGMAVEQVGGRPWWFWRI
jgi:hypothetical protein